MGLLLPVFVAYLLLCFGLQYFREPREVGPGPLVSSYIFMFAAFLLLWDIRLYPKSMRQLGTVSQCIIEFLVASFLLENIMVDFWFPLEVVVLAAAPKLADLLEELLSSGDWSCDGVCEYLRNEQLAFVTSYIMSGFFLLAVLHATRAIDLRELENGPACFFLDIAHRTKRYFKKQRKYLGAGKGKKKVHIKENRDKKCLPLSRSASIDHSSSRRKHNKINKGPCDDDLGHTFSDFEFRLNDSSSEYE